MGLSLILAFFESGDFRLQFPYVALSGLVVLGLRDLLLETLNLFIDGCHDERSGPLLPHMGTDDEMDAISNKAFAYGYLGGGLLLLVHLVMVMMIVDDNGSNPDWVIPFVMASSGAWWLGFAMLTFKYVPEPPIENEMESLSFSESASLAFTELRKTFGQIDRFKTLFIYMLAYFFFIDGINSVTALAGIYGITVLGLTTTALIATILVIQFVAAPCAIAFTKLAEATNTKYALTNSPNSVFNIGKSAENFRGQIMGERRLMASCSGLSTTRISHNTSIQHQ